MPWLLLSQGHHVTLYWCTPYGKLLSSLSWNNVLIPDQNGRHFVNGVFNFIFTEDLFFIQYFSETRFYGSQWQRVIIGAGNGLVPNRWKVITWTNDGKIVRRIFASVGPNEPIQHVLFYHWQISYSINTHIIFFKTIRTRIGRSYQPFRSLLSDKRNHRRVSLNWTSSPNEFSRGCKIADCVLIVTNLHKLYVSNKMTSPHHRCGAVILWWRHQMETFSALLALCAGNSPVTGEFPSQGQWRGALMFSLICSWINGWVNNREGGDLRSHRAHYDAIVM